ncbi:Predicted ABC-type ATPase [Cnuella takakiae]|uniref:Predicted ABC-type ATPase n=1 Tax=Cnuella takakiae TaxID=1302690 RepID=A0A1M5HRI4_9BACT|nr:zeta toxin family protein [Cnuella takakiae]OLY95648.1 hypothetical protein BUE76_00045 [Cnuella takakiae]SHG18540.1 Predicted ABC-type ATPase [Cnuella takakiae]
MSTFSERPTLFIVAGANGAGKSTRSRSMLPAYMEDIPIFDGDILFNEKKKELQQHFSAKESMQRAASFVSAHFDGLVSKAIQKRRHFAFEGHFTQKEHWQPILAFKNSGYYVHMVYLGLDKVETSLDRVARRVRTGGHYVDDFNVKANYYGNLDMLNLNAPLLHRLDLYDASRSLRHLAVLQPGRVMDALQPAEQPKWVQTELPKIATLINNRQFEEVRQTRGMAL